LALESDAVGIFNVGTGVPTDINMVHEVLSEVTGYEQAVTHVERPVGEVLATYLDSGKAKETLGWEAEVSLIDGLQETSDWFRAHRLGK